MEKNHSELLRTFHTQGYISGKNSELIDVTADDIQVTKDMLNPLWDKMSYGQYGGFHTKRKYGYARLKNEFCDLKIPNFKIPIINKVLKLFRNLQINSEHIAMRLSKYNGYFNTSHTNIHQDYIALGNNDDYKPPIMLVFVLHQTGIQSSMKILKLLRDDVVDGGIDGCEHKYKAGTVLTNNNIHDIQSGKKDLTIKNFEIKENIDGDIGTFYLINQENTNLYHNVFMKNDMNKGSHTRIVLTFMCFDDKNTKPIDLENVDSIEYFMNRQNTTQNTQNKKKRKSRKINDTPLSYTPLSSLSIVKRKR